MTRARHRCRSSSPGATWRYLDNGTDPGTALRGAGLRRHCVGERATRSSATATVTRSPSSASDPNANTKYVTTYFRRTLQRRQPGERDRPRTCACCVTTVRSSTSTAPRSLARTCRPARSRPTRLAPANVDGAAETTVLPVHLRRRVSLVAGVNTIAVEVHQNSRTSSDLSFDLSLDAEVNTGGGDTTTPSAPSALTLGTVTANSVALSWGASTDDLGVDHYTVLRNGTPIGTTGTTDFTDSTVTDGHTYTYTVVAVRRREQHVGSVERSDGQHTGRHPAVAAGSVGGTDADRHDRGDLVGRRRPTTSASTTTTSTGTTCSSAARPRRRSTTPGSRSRRATLHRRGGRRREPVVGDVGAARRSPRRRRPRRQRWSRPARSGATSTTGRTRAPHGGRQASTTRRGRAVRRCSDTATATKRPRSASVPNATQKYITTYFRTHVQPSPTLRLGAVAPAAPRA